MVVEMKALKIMETMTMMMTTITAAMVEEEETMTMMMTTITAALTLTLTLALAFSLGNLCLHKRALPMRMNYCWKIFGTYWGYCGIESEMVNLLEGRISP